MWLPFAGLAAALIPITAGIAQAQPADSMQRARELLGHGHTAEAIRLLETEATTRPEDPALRNMLASVLNREGFYPQALVHAEAAVRLRPGHAGYRANLGMVLSEHGRFEEAAHAFDLALSADSKLIYAWLERGAVWLARDRPDRAEADWRAARAVDAKLIWPDWYEATGHFVAGRFAEAAELYDRVAAAEPGFSAARLWAKLAHARAGRSVPAPAAVGTDWPSRLLQLLEGSAKLEAVLTDARDDRISGDARKTGEALFVAAQAKLIARDRASARALLREAVAVRAPRHVWKIAAERDLARLKSH